MEEGKVQDVRISVNRLKEKYPRIEKSMNIKHNALGADGQLNLEYLLGKKFLCLQVNALALKQHLQFELDGL